MRRRFGSWSALPQSGGSRSLRGAAYRIAPTTLAGDQSADVLAERGGERLVVQARHREALDEGSISNDAVQVVIAAQGHYGATGMVVLTNHARFSPSAVELARRCGVELWGRERLAALIEEFNGLPKDYRRLSEVLAQVRPSVPGAPARRATEEE